jgi:hypothetical protein
MLRRVVAGLLGHVHTLIMHPTLTPVHLYVAWDDYDIRNDVECPSYEFLHTYIKSYRMKL